jgi:hypothetical protein
VSEDLQDLIDSLQGRLDTEQEVLDSIEKQKAIHQDRVKRLRTSLRALRQEPEDKPQKKPSVPKPAPSAQMIQAILTVINEADKPLTIKEIEERSQRSHSATDYTVRYLRNQEMIRRARNRGMAHTYAPMNTTALKEADNGAAQLDAV